MRKNSLSNEHLLNEFFNIQTTKEFNFTIDAGNFSTGTALSQNK